MSSGLPSALDVKRQFDQLYSRLKKGGSGDLLRPRLAAEGDGLPPPPPPVLQPQQVPDVPLRALGAVPLSARTQPHPQPAPAPATPSSLPRGGPRVLTESAGPADDGDGDDGYLSGEVGVIDAVRRPSPRKQQAATASRTVLSAEAKRDRIEVEMVAMTRHKTVEDVSQRLSMEGTLAAPVKRPRGRPRKYPLNADGTKQQPVPPPAVPAAINSASATEPERKRLGRKPSARPQLPPSSRLAMDVRNSLLDRQLSTARTDLPVPVVVERPGRGGLSFWWDADLLGSGPMRTAMATHCYVHPLRRKRRPLSAEEHRQYTFYGSVFESQSFSRLLDENRRFVINLRMVYRYKGELEKRLRIAWKAPWQRPPVFLRRNLPRSLRKKAPHA